KFYFLVFFVLIFAKKSIGEGGPGPRPPRPARLALTRRFVAQESSGVTFFQQAESSKAAASSTVRVN
ncbi:hypothetical protein, partial [Rhodococcus baikonurensis]|uniref:hypothetical protein n=1 Tax=Rhodococcus baikonurensis TaxID=172041 RepID=UPI003392001E